MSAPRFGVWAPVYGNHGARLHPADATDAGYRRNRDLLRRPNGPVTTPRVARARHPPQQHRRRRPRNVVDIRGGGRGHLTDRTDRRDQATAAQPVGVREARRQHRGYLRRCRSVNVVTGWFLPELEGAGRRPARPRRSLRLLAGVARDRTDTVEGQAGPVGIGRTARSDRPTPAQPPPLYVGGESEQGRALAAEYADVFFINGRPFAETVEVIEDLRAGSRAARCCDTVCPPSCRR